MNSSNDIDSVNKKQLIAIIEGQKSIKTAGCIIPKGWGTAGKNREQLEQLLKDIQRWQPKRVDVIVNDGQEWVAAKFNGQDGFMLVGSDRSRVLKNSCCYFIYKNLPDSLVYTPKSSNVTLVSSSSSSRSKASSTKKRTNSSSSTSTTHRKKIKTEHPTKEEKEEVSREESHENKERESSEGSRNPFNRQNHVPLSPSLPSLSSSSATPSSSSSRYVPSRKFAVVIGNSDYPSHPLVAPLTDMYEMTNALTSLGYQVTSLPNPRYLDEVIKSFFNLLQENDSVIFYYAGHAIQKSGVMYLQSIAGNKHVSLIDIHEKYAKQKKLKRVGFILDACRRRS